MITFNIDSREHTTCKQYPSEVNSIQICAPGSQNQKNWMKTYIEMTRAAFMQLNNIWRSKKRSLGTNINYSTAT